VKDNPVPAISPFPLYFQTVKGSGFHPSTKEYGSGRMVAFRITFTFDIFLTT
jgi:hypothetical protein